MCLRAGVGHLGQPVRDGLHAVGLPGDSPVQQPSQFLPSCPHCSDNRCTHVATAGALMFRTLLISLDVFLCPFFLLPGRDGILWPPRRDPGGAPGNAPSRRAAACLELRCVTTAGVHVGAVYSSVFIKTISEPSKDLLNS